MRSTTWPRAVSIRIGVVTPRWRSVRHTSKPSRLGSITSSTIEIEGLRRGARQPQIAVASRFDGVAFGGEPIGQRELQPGFVFDEQQASCQPLDS